MTSLPFAPPNKTRWPKLQSITGESAFVHHGILVVDESFVEAEECRFEYTRIVVTFRLLLPGYCHLFPLFFQ